MRYLFTQIPELGGVFTITMSEFPTHCYSTHLADGRDCPRCREKSVAEVIGGVNQMLFEGVRSVQPEAICIAWSWVWGGKLTSEDIAAIASSLPSSTWLMATSEDQMEIEVGGKNYGRLNDYSISQVGPGPWASDFWKTVQNTGRRGMAKLQINNSWELSAIASLPVWDLIVETLDKLSSQAVEGLMLSWSLGGYPSLTLEVLRYFYWNTGRNDAQDPVKAVIEGHFTAQAQKRVRAAIAALSAAFREYPFHLCVAYYGPQHYGPMNLLFAKDSGRRATMVGFPYDHLLAWRGPYSEQTLERQFALLCRKWENGLKLLQEALSEETERESARGQNLHHLCRDASVALLHFRSTLQQIRFIRWRDRWTGIEEGHHSATPHFRQRVLKKLITLLRAEMSAAHQLERLSAEDSCIGFEGSNHYYYTWNDLREKILNCTALIAQFEASSPTSQ